MLFYEPRARDKSVLPHDPFKAIIAPRPIGWVTTMSKKGEINLAPYSFFNAFADRPPLLAFSSQGYKDSVAFIEETGEFVWNMPTYDLRDAMNATAAELERGRSEPEFAGLEMAPCRMVAPPRVAKSPAALECKLVEVKRLDRPARHRARLLAHHRRGRRRAPRPGLREGRHPRHGGDGPDRALRLQRRRRCRQPFQMERPPKP